MDKHDLPVGFSMSLAQDMEAMTSFVELGDYKQKEIMSYIKDSSTGDEAKERITQVVKSLHEHIY